MGKQLERYDLQQIESGLQLLAITGSPTKAAEQLTQELGRQVGEAQLRYWRDHSHQDRYLAIRREVLPGIQQRLAHLHEDAAKLAVEKSIQLLAKIDAENVPRDKLGSTLQNVATVSGIHFDKHRTARDMPLHIVESRDATDLLDAIGRTAPGAIVEGAAVEVEDAEVAA